MVCPCHEQERNDGKPFRKCGWNGRRLRDAWKTVQGVAATFRENANTLTLELCESDSQLHTWLVNAMRGAASYLLTRFGYLGVIPWAFCNADTQAGAADVIEQYASRPRHEHDPMSNDIMDELGADIQSVKSGELPSAAFRFFWSTITNTILYIYKYDVCTFRLEYWYKLVV